MSSTNNRFTDSVAFALAATVVITERIILPTLILMMNLLEEMLSSEKDGSKMPMPELKQTEREKEYVIAQTEQNAEERQPSPSPQR